MPVSGVVIQIEQERKAEILTVLSGMPEVQLQPVPDGGVLVAVLDTIDFVQENALVRALTALPGVRDVALSYHNFEDMIETGTPH